MWLIVPMQMDLHSINMANVRRAWLIEYVKRLALGLVVILVGMAILDYIVEWRTVFLYANSLFVAGAVFITIGAFLALPTWRKEDDSSNGVGLAKYPFYSLSIAGGFSLVLISILIHQFI